MSEKCCAKQRPRNTIGCSRLEDDFKGEALKENCNNNNLCFYSENGECGGQCCPIYNPSRTPKDREHANYCSDVNNLIGEDNVKSACEAARSGDADGGHICFYSESGSCEKYPFGQCCAQKPNNDVPGCRMIQNEYTEGILNDSVRFTKEMYKEACNTSNNLCYHSENDECDSSTPPPSSEEGKCCAYNEKNIEDCRRYDQLLEGEDMKEQCNNSNICYYSENGECDSSTPSPSPGGDDKPPPSSGGDDKPPPSSGGDDKPPPSSGGDDNNDNKPIKDWVLYWVVPGIISLIFSVVCILLFWRNFPYTNKISMFIQIFIFNYIGINTLFRISTKLTVNKVKVDFDKTNMIKLFYLFIAILALLLPYFNIYKRYLIRYFSLPISKINDMLKNTKHELTGYGAFKIQFWKIFTGINIIPCWFFYLIFGSSQKIYLPIT